MHRKLVLVRPTPYNAASSWIRPAQICVRSRAASLIITPFNDTTADPNIRGFLHAPDAANGDGIVLTHGAGSNCQAKLLVDMANVFAASGFTVLRIDLPFRQTRRYGPPFPSAAGKDRDGIRRALALLRSKVNGRVFGAGHSYGGRQTTILMSEEPQLADGLLLLSYPLHPPQKPTELRTSHFPKLAKPAFFVHGTRDPFGSISEMNVALELISGPHMLMKMDGAGHDLHSKDTSENYSRIVGEFQQFVDSIESA
jgi:uncharacterized protein